MATAAFSPRKSGASSAPYVLPAPVGGWNARDSAPLMPRTDALELVNYWPAARSVQTRAGSKLFAQGLRYSVEQLLPFQDDNPANNKFFASTTEGIFDITEGGSSPVLQVPLTEGDVSYTTFETPAGQYLIAVNGYDNAHRYSVSDGWIALTSSSSPALTGVPSSSLSYVNVFKRRLWFIERNSMSAWYLPVDQIGGALSEFPLGAVFSRGGTLLTMGNWTIDAGNGKDDYAVFVSNLGEVAVYQGTDPSDAASFSHVGTYFIGRPFSKHCLVRQSGDLLLLCEFGVFPLSKAAFVDSSSETASLVDKISNAFQSASALRGKLPHWRIAVFPGQRAVIVNIPSGTKTAEQFVFNSDTKAWARFKGWDAFCFALFNGKLYFGGNGKVFQAWEGVSDAGLPIQASARQAFVYLPAAGQKKFVHMIQPVLEATNNVEIDVGLDIEFRNKPEFSTISLEVSEGSRWGNAHWGTAKYTAESALEGFWTSIPQDPANAHAVCLRISSASARVVWSATTLLYQKGSIL